MIILFSGIVIADRNVLTPTGLLQPRINENNFCMQYDNCTIDHLTVYNMSILVKQNVTDWTQYDNRYMGRGGERSNKTVYLRNLSMDTLFVHNITGRSPIIFGSPIISYSNITSTFYYGSGKYLSDINYSTINQTVNFYDDVVFHANISMVGGGDFSTTGDVSAINLLPTGYIDFGTGTGIKRLMQVNAYGTDGFTLEYRYDFELPNDDWLIFRKTDGNDPRPDGGFGFMMTNSTGNNRTVLKIDGYNLANFTDYNIKTTGNISGRINASNIINSPWILTADEKYLNKNSSKSVNFNETKMNQTVKQGYYNKTFLDQYLYSGGSRLYWFTNQTNGAFSRNMTLTFRNGTRIAEITTPIGTETVKLGLFITQKQTQPVIYVAGVRNIYVMARMTNANRVITLQSKVFLCRNYNEATDTCGTLTSYVNSSISNVLTTTNAVYYMDYFIPTLYALNMSDRFIVNITATKISGLATNIILSVDDMAYSRIQVPSPVGVTDIQNKLDKTDQRYNDTSKINAVNHSIYNIYNMTREPTGFPDQLIFDSMIRFNDGTRKFNISVNKSSHNYFDIYYKGDRIRKYGVDNITIPTTAGQTNYIYYDSTGTLKQSTAVWNNDFFNVIQVATVYWNGTNGTLGYERHGLEMDSATHYWMHTTVGTRYVSGLTGTFTNPASWSMTSGTIADEDNFDFVPAQTRARVWYRKGSIFTFTPKQTALYRTVTNLLQYDLNGISTPVDNNKYVAYWVLATVEKDSPIMVIMGQRQDTTLLEAQTNNKYESLSLGALSIPEFKILYRVILRRDGTSVPTLAEVQDLRGISNLPSGTYVATDINSLTGLTTDFAQQYLRTDGTRQLSGNWNYGNKNISGAGNISVGGNFTVKEFAKIYKGGSAGKAICWKADGYTLGYCSSAVDITGSCTCN